MFREGVYARFACVALLRGHYIKKNVYVEIVMSGICMSRIL
jgi:hypothetical protein